MLEEIVEAVLTEEVAAEVVKGMSYTIFSTQQLSPDKEKELLFEGGSEKDAAVAVVHKEMLTEDELVCL